MGAKRRAWLMPAILGLSAAVVLAALATMLSNRHRRKDTLQLQAEVARLNGGIVQQGELLRRAEQGHVLGWPPAKRAETREALKAQSEELRQKNKSGWRRFGWRIPQEAASGDADSLKPARE